MSLRGAKRRGNPPKPSPGEKVAERKRGRKWNAGRNVGRGESIDFLKCRSGISLSIYRTLGDHPHSTSVICSFFANASLRSSERPVGGSDSPPGCHSLPPTALRLPREKLLAASRTDCPEASPYRMWETFQISVSLRGAKRRGNPCSGESREKWAEIWRSG